MHRSKLFTSLAAAGAGMAIAVALAASDPASNPTPSNRSQTMSHANERVVTYIAAWNERDARRRRELVASTWAEDGRYVDAHRQAAGHAAIDAMIDQAQHQFPGYKLRLVSGIEAHNDHVRFSWGAGGSDGAPLYLGGTDFAVLSSDGRFRSVTGFVDAAPAR
jgi:hypothetical protein